MAVARFSPGRYPVAARKPLIAEGVVQTPHRNEIAGPSEEEMRTQEVRRKGHKSELSFGTLVSFLIIFLASLFIHPPPDLSADASQLVSAADRIAEQFTADLSKGPEVGGRVSFDIPPAGVVLKFDRSGARPDSEYLLTREAEKPGTAFPVVIGAVRLTEVRDDVARGILLWSQTAPRPGDRVVHPPSVTIFLVPATDLARHPGASATVADQALELALSRKPRLRVVRLAGPPDADEVAKRLKATGEIGLFLEPVLLPDPGGVKLAAKARSVLSGQTTATYAEAVSLAPTVAQPSPPPTPPSEKTVPPAIPPAATPPAKADVAPPGFVFPRQERQPGAIVREGEKTGPIRKEVAETLIAITAADVDGDGRPELVGISETGVFVYRWTDKGFVQGTGYLEREKFVRYLAVDAADINGNGREEIFVTAISSVPAGIEMRNRLQSFALELDGRTLKPVASGLPYFLRVERIPGQDQALLLAQEMGTHDPFSGPVLKMTWKGGQYVQQGPLPTPGKNTWMYDFTILEVGDKGSAAVTSVNWKGYLLVYRNGEEIWEGKENLGQVDHAGFLQTPRAVKIPEGLRAMTQPRTEAMADRRVIGRRILVARPLFGDGSVELITVANRVRVGVQLRLFGEVAGAASVVGYVDTGNKFEKHWETEPVEGVARDLVLADFDGDGRRDVVLLSAIEDKASLNLFLLRPAKGA